MERKKHRAHGKHAMDSYLACLGAMERPIGNDGLNA